MLNLVRERLGAAGAQLGRKMILEGQEIIEYIAAAEGQEDMVGRVRICTCVFCETSCFAFLTPLSVPCCPKASHLERRTRTHTCFWR